MELNILEDFFLKKSSFLKNKLLKKLYLFFVAFKLMKNSADIIVNIRLNLSFRDVYR